MNLYNQILQTLHDVEKPLVQQKMDNIDKVLQRGLVHMNWKSHTITDFISQCTTMVKEVHGIVQVIKSNVVETRRILDSWSENLLLERKLTRTYLPDELMALQNELKEQRYGEIIAGSEQIHSCLGLSQKTLRATRGSTQFKAYIDHVNQILNKSVIPADINKDILEKAQQQAKLIAEKLNYIGTMCVEYFIDENSNLLINEIAPRVHNSGHLTINAYNVSQFENHVRAVCNLEKKKFKKNL